MSVFYEDLYGRNPLKKHILDNSLGLSPWAIGGGIFALGLMGVFATGLVLKTWAPLFLAGILCLLTISPFLIRHEQWLFWAWMVAFPILYGFNLLPVTYILIPLTLPGALYSLLKNRAANWEIAAHWITIPLWLFAIGLACNMPFIKQAIKPDWLLRDIGYLLVTLYLVAISWKKLVQKPRHTRHLFFGLVGMGIFNGLVICFQKLFHVGLVNAGGSTQMLRPMGVLSHPNPAGFMILLPIVLVLYGYFSTVRPRAKQIYGGALILLLLSCLFTLSKTSIVQLIPILGIWMVLLPGRLKYQALGLGFGVMAIMGFWSVFINQNAVFDNLIRRFSQSDTLAIRQKYWQIVMEHMNAFTLMFGNGYRSSAQLLGEYNYNYALFQVDYAMEGGPGIFHCHNAYLKYVYEMGLWAIGIFAAYALMLLKSAKCYFTTRSPRQKLANLALASMFLLLLVEGLTEVLILDHPYVVIYFAIATLVLSVEAGWFEALNIKRGADPRTEIPAV